MKWNSKRMLIPKEAERNERNLEQMKRIENSWEGFNPTISVITLDVDGLHHRPAHSIPRTTSSLAHGFVHGVRLLAHCADRMDSLWQRPKGLTMWNHLWSGLWQKSSATSVLSTSMKKTEIGNLDKKVRTTYVLFIGKML